MTNQINNGDCWHTFCVLWEHGPRDRIKIKTKQRLRAGNLLMKISPDPLQPLRNWRELWLAEPSAAELARRCQSEYQSRHWKKQKQPSFNWLVHILNRDVQD